MVLGKPEELIFVRGTTEALNLVANSYGQIALNGRDCIILTEMEHHANIYMAINRRKNRLPNSKFPFLMTVR